MTSELHNASRNRVLVITTHDAVAEVLAEQATGRPIAALLTSSEKRPAALESVIQALLNEGCEYFVCWGVGSEALHDQIDELLLEHVALADHTVMTTWHDDEPAGDVAEFFFNVAAEKNGALLLAVLEENDGEMARLLARQASIGG